MMQPKPASYDVIENIRYTPLKGVYMGVPTSFALALGASAGLGPGQIKADRTAAAGMVIPARLAALTAFTDPNPWLPITRPSETLLALPTGCFAFCSPFGLEHGKRSTYIYDRCRCEACCKAESDYQKEYKRRKKKWF